MEPEDAETLPEKPGAKKPLLSRGWAILLAAVITGLFLILEILLGD